MNLKDTELEVVSREGSTTKNYRSRRIPISTALEVMLRRHPRRLGCELVFPNNSGQAYNNINMALKSASQRAGISPQVRIHQLRHAFCSHALMAGVDPRTVIKWMGHQDLRTTLGYTHVSRGHEKSAIQLLHYDSGHHMETETGTE